MKESDSPGSCDPTEVAALMKLSAAETYEAAADLIGELGPKEAEEFMRGLAHTIGAAALRTLERHGRQSWQELRHPQAGAKRTAQATARKLLGDRTGTKEGPSSASARRSGTQRADGKAGHR